MAIGVPEEAAGSGGTRRVFGSGCATEVRRPSGRRDRTAREPRPAGPFVPALRGHVRVEERKTFNSQFPTSVACPTPNVLAPSTCITLRRAPAAPVLPG